MEFRRMMRSKLEKSFIPNMIRKELKTLKSLRLSSDVWIPYGDRGNCIVVLDESKYKDKLNILLKAGVYEPLPKVR
jgi:hypothetical protein